MRRFEVGNSWAERDVVCNDHSYVADTLQKSAFFRCTNRQVQYSSTSFFAHAHVIFLLFSYCPHIFILFSYITCIQKLTCTLVGCSWWVVSRSASLCLFNGQSIKYRNMPSPFSFGAVAVHQVRLCKDETETKRKGRKIGEKNGNNTETILCSNNTKRTRKLWHR